MNLTLKEIAEQHHMSVQTVKSRKIEAERVHGGITYQVDPNDRRRKVYTPEQVALIMGKPMEPVATVVTVETGNHMQVLSAPEIGTEYSLEPMRCDDIEALLFDDPMAIADQFIDAADRIVGAMGNDVRTREQRLQQTKAARNKVASKAQELRLEQRLYRDRARDLDTDQTSETKALQDSVADLQRLGKPQADGQTS